MIPYGTLSKSQITSRQTSSVSWRTNRVVKYTERLSGIDIKSGFRCRLKIHHVQIDRTFRCFGCRNKPVGTWVDPTPSGGRHRHSEHFLMGFGRLMQVLYGRITSEKSKGLTSNYHDTGRGTVPQCPYTLIVSHLHSQKHRWTQRSCCHRWRG